MFSLLTIVCWLLKQQSKDAICLVDLLDVYCSMFGQLVNHAKLQIMFSPSTNARVKSQICNLFHIPEQTRGWKYLRVPLSSISLSPRDAVF